MSAVISIDAAGDAQEAVSASAPGTAKIRVGSSSTLEVSVNGRPWSSLSTASAGTLTLAAGEQPGLSIADRSFGEGYTVTGATALATITGYNTGAAGVGTSTTSLVKPAGGVNWVSNALRGKWVLVGSTLRPIISNTTTAITIAAITGLSSGTAFSIVDLASIVDQISESDPVAIRIASCVGAVEIRGVDFSTANTLTSLIVANDCTSVRFVACRFNQNLSSAAVDIQRCTRVRFEYCNFSGSADAAISKCQFVEVTGCNNYSGGVVAITDAFSADVTKLTALSAPSRVLSMTRVSTATVEAACSSSGATPIYLESVATFLAVGGLLTGTGNTGYGLEIAFSGLMNITGSSITGSTGDVLFEGNAVTWALELGVTYGRVASATGSAIAQAVPTKTILYGNFLFNGSGDHSSRELYYGIINPAQNTGITATGTVVGDAYQLPAGQHYGIGTVAAGTGVKLHNASALAGPCCVVDNNGANTLKIYPGGGGTINGAASIDLAAGAITMLICCDFATDKWKAI